MSAFTVCKAHIDVLVNAAAEYGALDRHPNELGQTLWQENYNRVNCRYGENEPAPRYTVTTTEAPLHPVAVLSAIQCYQYQIAEGYDWRESEAYELTERLRQAVYARDPKLGEMVPSPCRYEGMRPAFYDHPLYERMPWEFARLSDAEAHRWAAATANA